MRFTFIIFLAILCFSGCKKSKTTISLSKCEKNDTVSQIINNHKSNYKSKNKLLPELQIGEVLYKEKKISDGRSVKYQVNDSNQFHGYYIMYTKTGDTVQYSLNYNNKQVVNGIYLKDFVLLTVIDTVLLKDETGFMAIWEYEKYIDSIYKMLIKN